MALPVPARARGRRCMRVRHRPAHVIRHENEPANIAICVTMRAVNSPSASQGCDMTFSSYLRPQLLYCYLTVLTAELALDAMILLSAPADPEKCARTWTGLHVRWYPGRQSR